MLYASDLNLRLEDKTVELLKKRDSLYKFTMAMCVILRIKEYLLVLAVVLSVIYGVDGQQGQGIPSLVTTPTSAVRYALILKKLGEVTQGRAALQARAQRFRETVDTLLRTETHQRDSCVCFNTSAIAFTAHLDKNIATLGIDQALPFDNVTLNAGHGYDARHAQFRAPVNGTYQFSVTISTNTAYKVAADIMLNGNPLVKIRTGNENYVNTASNEVTVHLTAGNDVWVQHDHAITDNNRLYVAEGMLTTFSGHLVNRD